MVRRGLDVLLVGLVVVACSYALAAVWTVGGTDYVYGGWVLLALLLAVVVVGVRTVLRLRALPESARGARNRAAVLPVLVFVTVVLTFTQAPEKLRLALSSKALDDYAGTVTATDWDDCGPPRRVGLYTVTCAYRGENGAVTLHVRDRLTPDSIGIPYLVGPGSWEWGTYD